MLHVNVGLAATVFIKVVAVVLDSIDCICAQRFITKTTANIYQWVNFQQITWVKAGHQDRPPFYGLSRKNCWRDRAGPAPKILSYPSICHTDNPQAILLLFGH